MARATSYIATEVFQKLSANDEQAFAAIFHEYNASLHLSVQKLVKSEEMAREIIQEVFLKLWINRHAVAGMQQPQGWLFTVASNLCLDALRRRARQPEIINEPDSDEPPHGPDLALLLEGKNLQTLIDEAVDLLPGARKEIFNLSRRSGLNRQQIAEQLQLSEHTVKNQLTASLKFVRDYLLSRGADIPFSIVAIIFFLNR